MVHTEDGELSTHADLENKFNSTSSSFQHARFTFGNGMFLGEIMETALGAVTDVAMGALSGVTFGLADAIKGLLGDGYVDIPEHWQSSSASLPTASYKMTLYSPYGNAISQVMNLFLPFAMLAAGSWCRSTGRQSYTAPFLCQLYDRGRVQIPLGMITEFSVASGTGNIGFSPQGAPLAMELSFRIKDYIAVPKPNGYQSLHTTVLTPAKQIVEFQIRTYEMHEFAERGLAASFHYHEQKSTKAYTQGKKSAVLPAHMQWITQLQEIATKLRSGEDIPQSQLSIDLFGNRIFVYSPRGDIYNLPEGAFPLDFAYLVHSDIGKHAYSFKVNGSIHPFDKPLQNGDVVEVVTRKSSSPKQTWLEMVTTTHARAKLRAQLRKVGAIQGISHAAGIIREKTRRKQKAPSPQENAS
jgi:hypothetical protein